MRNFKIVIAFIFVFYGCGQKRSTVNYVWENEKAGVTKEELKVHFRFLKSQGVDGVMYSCPSENYKRVADVAKIYDLELHAWIPTLLGGNKKELFDNHPECFAVNGKGVSSHTSPPFVDYYRWLCPSHEPVYEYLKKMYSEIADIDGVDGVHLDYIRFSDVILAKSLWKKYDVVMDKEYPQWDFCYCDKCVDGFKNQSGIDIKKVEDASTVPQWKEYRYGLITKLVNRLTSDIHAKNKKITAAVFPGPSVSTKIVRQRWSDWQLDAYYPMNYSSFYEEDVKWIGDMCKEGVGVLKDNAPLYSGLYIPGLKSVDEFRKAIKESLDNGAKGVCLFTPENMTKEHWKVFRDEVFK